MSLSKKKLAGFEDVIWEDEATQDAEEQSQASSEFQELLEETPGGSFIKEGSIVAGSVISVTDDVVHIDIGHKSDGEIPISEFRDVEGNILVKQGDKVEVCTQTRKNGRIYRAVGRVRCADPARPHYVRLYGRKNYRRVLQNFTRQWTLMISNDTQSSAEDSISQSY